jgi:L-ascorbate metabolism protein UlaG (beta-lactamase superfamily)
MNIKLTRLSEPLATVVRTGPAGAELYWLGQAGFLFRSSSLSWVIDPYLSDRLSEKYRHHDFSHARMMPPPINVSELPDIEFVFCTHHHGDHLDGPTIEWLAANKPNIRFVVPAGIAAEVAPFALPAERIIWAKADEPLTLGPSFDVVPIPAAHEEFSYDEAGHHRFLGYVFHIGPFIIYHSGDTIPYDGLNQRLVALNPKFALLPVNGRSRELSQRDIAGNFSLAEAIELCRIIRIQFLIAHHFGMFAFNTIAPALVGEAARTVASAVTVVKAEVGVRYGLQVSA